MPKLRSPILGYNHNLRHRGRSFHVQTEDSGVQNPRIFTHLFHAGVIIATKRVEYDAEADGDVVKSLMQAQHKAVLRELKSGAFDDKIGKLLGEAPDAAVPTPLPPETSRPAATYEDTDEDEYAQIIIDESDALVVSGTLEQAEEEGPVDVSSSGFRRIGTPAPVTVSPPQRAPTPQPVTVPPAPPAPAAPAREPAGLWVMSRSGQQERPFEKSGPIRTPPPPPPVRRPGMTTPMKLPEVPTPPPPPLVQRRRPSALQPVPPDLKRPSAPPPPPGTSSTSSRANTAPLLPVVPPAPRAATPVTQRPKPMDSIVVARPAVVIGAPPPPPAEARKPARESTPPPAQDSIFGQDLISEKSLDEVIMAYLSEDANDD